MSIVSTGILRYLYDDARTAIENKSSELWQHYLKQEFRRHTHLRRDMRGVS
jgi:hypothetical protein